MIYISTLFVAMYVAISLIAVRAKTVEKVKAIDVPDERKVHTVTMPRFGGIAIANGVFVALFLWEGDDLFLKAYLIGAAVIVFFGIIDDLKGLNYKIKFLYQLACALIIVFYGGLKITYLGTLLPENMVLSEWVAIPLTILLILGVTNAVNLVDGLDGLAGGICLLSFCCIGYLAYTQNNIVITLIALALIGALFGFLWFNTFPASIFMGDTGSQLLGFSLATISVSLTQGSTSLSPFLPILLCGFPVLDTLTVMVSRIAAGHSPFMPDKRHFHHRFLNHGFSHSESVFVIYVLQAILVASAFLFRSYSEWTLLIGYGLFSMIIIGCFWGAAKSNFTLKHYDLFDIVIKGKLKILRERGFLIIVSFKIIEFGLPLLLFVTCIIPKTIPVYLSIGSAVMVVPITVIWFLKKRWLRVPLMMTLYTLIPLMIYLSIVEGKLPDDLDYIEFIYNAAFALMAFFVILTLKFTRRTQGFKFTTMDFLIFFIALAAPYIAGIYTMHKDIGIVAIKTIILFYGYRVLIGELRGEQNKLAFMTICTLIVIAVQGLIRI